MFGWNYISCDDEFSKIRVEMGRNPPCYYYFIYSLLSLCRSTRYVEWMVESVVIYRYYIHRGLIWALYLAPNEVRCLWQRFIRVTLPTLGWKYHSFKVPAWLYITRTGCCYIFCISTSSTFLLTSHWPEKIRHSHYILFDVRDSKWLFPLYTFRRVQSECIYVQKRFIYGSRR